MPYLIDSDCVIDHLAGEPTMTAFLEQLSASGIAISIITYMESYQGVLQSSNPTLAEAGFQAFMAGVPVLAFSPSTAKVCARLRIELKKQGKRTTSRALDLMNAAIALENGLTLVTRNIADYHDISNLKVKTPPVGI